MMMGQLRVTYVETEATYLSLNYRAGRTSAGISRSDDPTLGRGKR